MPHQPKFTSEGMQLPQRFRKLPVVITAMQAEYDEEIQTLEGLMMARKGDWIITGVAGEQYACNPHIFNQTYELAEK